MQRRENVREGACVCGCDARETREEQGKVAMAVHVMVHVHVSCVAVWWQRCVLVATSAAIKQL